MSCEVAQPLIWRQTPPDGPKSLPWAYFQVISVSDTEPDYRLASPSAGILHSNSTTEASMSQSHGPISGRCHRSEERVHPALEVHSKPWQHALDFAWGR